MDLWRLLLLTACALGAAVAAGCTTPEAGADDAAGRGDAAAPTPTPDAGASGARTPFAVDVSLTGAYPVNIAYAPARIEAPSGSRVTVTFRNTDTSPTFGHDWVLEGVEGAATDVIQPGQSDTVEFDAPAPGEYAFYCSVPGHRDRGMQGTFVVAA
jgi:plastocyanin